jgi:ferric-dicitrate binding protein FerR (iron transport regulator)
MTPDPESENAVRERVQALLADAPEPDTARLAAGLQAARSANRRHKRGRRTLAWLAAALLFGAGAATAGWWWLGTGGRGEPAPAPSKTEGVSEPADASSDGRANGRADESGGTDSGLIYQGVD